MTTIKSLHKALSNGKTSVTDLCAKSFNIIDSTRNLNAFITVCEDAAKQKARDLDKTDARQLKPLHGIPISIKDNFCTSQLLTTCGSKMLHNFLPSYNATAVTKLLKSDCIVVGKTNMDEFAMGSSCTTSHFGPAANVFNHGLMGDRTLKELKPHEWFMAGGSTTGGAIAVSTGACYASLGTDTGGSTRQPASLNGVVGFKPSYGLISRYGLIPLVHSLDVVSLLARNVDDVSLIFDEVVGQDEKDLTTVDYEAVINRTITQELLTDRTIRIGVPSKFIEDGDLSHDVSKRYEDIANFLEKGDIGGGLKMELVRIELNHSRFATECYTIISCAEIASNMSCYDGVKYGLSVGVKECRNFDRDEYFKENRDAGFGAEVKKRIMFGNFLMMADNRAKYLDHALKVRRLIEQDFARAFKQDKLDLILMPSTPSTSISYEEWLKRQDNNRLFHEDYFLIPSNLANVPSISLPSGLSKSGLPIGIQLVADKYHDPNLLLLSRIFENKILNQF